MCLHISGKLTISKSQQDRLIGGFVVKGWKKANLLKHPCLLVKYFYAVSGAF
jgi:hypothetical protein